MPGTIRLNDLSRNVVTSYSLRAYVDLLPVAQRQNVAQWLHTQTSEQLASMFRYALTHGHLICACRFEHAVAHIDDEPANECAGAAHACRLALMHKYAELPNVGYEAYKSAPPVVYISPAMRPTDLTPMFKTKVRWLHLCVRFI
jgi:hypothetical protein